MNRYDVGFKKKGSENGRKKHTAVMISVVPVIKRRVVLAKEYIVISDNVILDYDALNADGIIRWRAAGKLENTFTKERNPII
jgi:hypothetical protein